MSKILGYLKSYVLSLIFMILLIGVMVGSDLALPNLMSDIISVGIQQGGVEHAFPDAVSEKGLRLMTSFMTEEEQQLVKEQYVLEKAGSDSDLIRRYPLLETEDVYVLQSVSGETRSALDSAFGGAAGTMMSLGQSLGQEASDTSASADMELSKIYAMLPMLEQMPNEQMEQARSAAASEYNEALGAQMGVAFARKFYDELGVDGGAVQTGYLLRTGGIMLALTLINVIATILISLISARMAAGVARVLRRDVFHKVTAFSNAEFDRFSTASLITRTTNDITQIQMFLTMGIRTIIRAPLTGVWGTVMALQKSVSLGWVIGLSVLVLLCLIGVVFVIAMPKFTKMQKLVDRMNLVARENLSGIMVIRAFNNEEFEKGRYDDANRDLANTQLFVNRLMVVMMPVMMLIMNLTSMLIVWIGAHQIAASAMQIGDMMAFMQYSMQIILSFLMIAMMFIMVPRAAVSAKRIREILDSDIAVKDPEQPASFDPEKRGVVEFRDVSFRYGDAESDVIEHISFTAVPGKTTAFIGSTGSGKSTLLNLIPRFYDCTEGQVLVNGADVRDVRQQDLRERIGYVPQKGILHKGTIGSNIAYGRPGASEEDVAAAAEVAQAMDFIRKMNGGMASEIAAGGTNVSGGQKQRLSIARALVRKPDIYLFDDSFSALDFRTDAALRKALKTYTEDATVLIVAQRVGTILNADQILVMDKGKIVGRGTHRELLQTCPVYYEIASSQLTKEELS